MIRYLCVPLRWDETSWRVIDLVALDAMQGELRLGVSEFVGIIDWLPSSDGRLHGFLYHLSTEWEALGERAVMRARVVVPGVIECLFREGEVDQQKSGDQAFDEVRIFEGADGTIAFAFPEVMFAAAEGAELMDTSSVDTRFFGARER
jgi:hypothetical protein